MGRTSWQVTAALLVGLAACAPASRVQDGGAAVVVTRPGILVPAAPVTVGADTVTVLRSGEPNS